MIRLRWINGLKHNHHLSLEWVEQKKYLETNAFPIDVEPMLI